MEIIEKDNKCCFIDINFTIKLTENISQFSLLSWLKIILAIVEVPGS